MTSVLQTPEDCLMNVIELTRTTMSPNMDFSWEKTVESKKKVFHNYFVKSIFNRFLNVYDHIEYIL